MKVSKQTVAMHQPKEMDSTENLQGSMGSRKVRQEVTQMPRLDKIKGTTPPKGNIFLRPFYSQKTNVGRTARSLHNKAGAALNSLKRETGGQLDMQKLLNAMKTLRLHTDKINSLTPDKRVDHVELLQISLAGQLASTDNRELLDGFSTFMSEDMTKLRNLLEQETRANPHNLNAKQALEDLGVMEATLMMEVSTRVARSRSEKDEVIPTLQDRLFTSDPTPGKDVLRKLYKKKSLSIEAQTRGVSDRDLETIVNAGGRSSAFRNKLQKSGDERLMNKGVHEVSLKEVGDAIRQSDLTINFTLKNLLGIGRKTSPIKEDQGIRNMFQWGRDPEENQALKKRDLTERGFFPTLEKDALDPDSRPIYGAMNVGRQTAGGADSYGGAFFVLKPEVKKRCTFTRDDTFNVTMCSVNKKNLKTFTDGVDTLLGKLSVTAQKTFSDDAGALKLSLINYFSKRSDTEAFSVYKLPENMKAALAVKGVGLQGISDNDFDIIANFAEKTFRDIEATREQVVDFDDVESLLPFIGEDRLDAIMASVTNPKQKDVRIGNYIEAQVHGSVNFAEDIEAMRLSDWDIKSGAKALLRDRHKGENGYFPRGEELKRAKEEVRLQLEAFCEKNGIKMEIYDDKMMVRDQMRSKGLRETFTKAHADVLKMSQEYVSDPSMKEGSFKSILSKTAETMGFTESLSQKVLDALPNTIARASQSEVGGNHGKLTKEILAKVTTTVIKDAIARQMAETQKANQQQLDSFLSFKAAGPDSFKGVLDKVKKEKGFDDVLNDANLKRLGANIHKAFDKVNNGNPMEMSSITKLAKKEIERFVDTKQTLLKTLDEMTFEKSEHLNQWQSFVLESSTLREPEMLKALHTQSKKAHTMLKSLLSEDGLKPESLLKALQTFTTEAGDVQLKVYDELGKDLPRDARHLFIDRSLSLAVTTMDTSKEEKQTLYDALTGEKTGAIRSGLMKQGVDALLAENMAETLFRLARNVGRELEIGREEVDRTMNKQYLEGEGLEILPSDVQKALDQTVKVQTLKVFPSPGKTVNMSFEEFRKKELPQILDIYKANEKKFDQTLIHGRMHISRALIYTRALSSMFREKGLNPNTHALYRSIAFHDSGRESNGADVYEGKSAKKLIDHLKEEGIDSKFYLGASGRCISCGKDIQTLEEGIMNSSDAMEIMRTVGRNKFDTNRLWFMRQPVRDSSGTLISPDTELRDKLLDEVGQFIKSTDLPELKEEKDLEEAMSKKATKSEELMRLNDLLKSARESQLESHWETSSENFFSNMEQVLLTNSKKFPILHKYYTMYE